MILAMPRSGVWLQGAARSSRRSPLGARGLLWQSEDLMVEDALASANDDDGNGFVALCDVFVNVLPVTGASISITGGVGMSTVVSASDVIATQLEQLQFDLGEGPQWEVLRSARPVYLDDLNDGAVLWPVFGAAALDLGVRSLFSFPLQLGVAVVGVVELYRLTPGGLSVGSVAMALSLCRTVTTAAIRAAMISANEVNPTTPAPVLRREVHQAVGMILVQLDTDATEAFARLRGYAFATGRSVQDVARDVVNRDLDFTTLPD
jgi:GAF domain-containing protein